MISSVRNFSVRILDADRFTIVIFQILDIKSNYLPGIVQFPTHPKARLYLEVHQGRGWRDPPPSRDVIQIGRLWAEVEPPPLQSH
jgi:hypothetical protein